MRERKLKVRKRRGESQRERGREKGERYRKEDMGERECWEMKKGDREK